MEDVLDLNAEPYDPKHPKVNFDEASKQLIAETRPALPAKPGHPEPYDYEYPKSGAIFQKSARGRTFKTFKSRRDSWKFARGSTYKTFKSPFCR
jgi:hypothetical protein